ncbi:hypothetical protein [Pseudomonas trivialis]|uniref:hypothetical protein n=1 Tax=Pseudomonas trivialis TaxID=200450 RepID=UPI0030CF90F6
MSKCGLGLNEEQHVGGGFLPTAQNPAGKFREPAALQFHVYVQSPQTLKRVAAVLINLPAHYEVDDSIHLTHLDIRLFGFQKKGAETSVVSIS